MNSFGSPTPQRVASESYGGNLTSRLNVGMEQQRNVSAVAASQPHRQPRGPPCAVDELGEMNFATRMRRKTFGSVGAMVDAARERREAAYSEVVAF
jgi:hypothetical protein